MEPEYLILAVASLFAGFIDAVAGGGGLVQLPALFVTFPDASAPALFGTNKAASITGTATAAAQYLRRVQPPVAVVTTALATAAVGAWLGARTVSGLPDAAIRPAVLVLLVLVAVYTLRERDLGVRHAPRLVGRAALLEAAGAGFALGYYDGIFGPGTGAFLIFVFVRMFGYDFLHASAAAKFVNVATNAAALIYFGGHGDLLWPLAGVMAASNIGGAALGSRLALRFGAVFVRRVFLIVVGALIAKLAFDLALVA